MKNQAPLWVRLAVVLVFAAFGVFTVGFLLVNTGADIPIIGRVGSYKIALNAKQVDNLEHVGHVRMAGLQIGQVESRTIEGDHVRIMIAVNSKYAPLHEGATVRIGAKSLVEETYLDMTDGNGPPLPSGATLPDNAVKPNVQVDDIISSLNPQAREDLGAVLRSAGASTAGTRENVSQMLAGLGRIGNEGHSALDAIAAQSNDLRSLVKETTAVLTALDTSEGEIARLTTNADHLTKASADQRQALEHTFIRLPGVLDSARKATDKLTDLSGSLQPVAADLQKAAPDLSDALDKLPQPTHDLRAAMPSLTRILDRAPDTLHRVPTLKHDLSDELIPRTRDILQDANPILRYLRPYGVDLGAYVALNGAAWGYHDEAGTNYFRLFQINNDTAVSSPVDQGSLLGTYKNAIPRPRSGTHPGPFVGKYPRLEREPR